MNRILAYYFAAAWLLLWVAQAVDDWRCGRKWDDEEEGWDWR